MLPQALITPLLMLAFGQLFRRLAVLPENAAEVLNAFVLYLCLPALVLSVLLVAVSAGCGTRLNWPSAGRRVRAFR